MYKQILVAVDGSRSAERAVDEAIKVAKATGGRVIALSIVLHPARLVDVASGFAEEQTRDSAEHDVATAALEDAKARFEAAQVSGTVRAADSHGEEIAAVIAARLMPCEPNGASTSDARPVVAISGDDGVG